MRNGLTPGEWPHDVVLNQQQEVPVDLSAVRGFTRRLKSVLRLRGRDFNLCFIDDLAMRRLNGQFRGKHHSTDVLSFPWTEAGSKPLPEAMLADSRLSRRVSAGHNAGETSLFLGEIAISAPMARRNARREGHTTANEIRWLILHGVLHLLGYDHENDNGDMRAFELALRTRLRI